MRYGTDTSGLATILIMVEYMMDTVYVEKGKKMIDVKYPNGMIGDSNSNTVANNSSEYSTAQDLYYEQLQEQSDRDYVEVVRCKDCENWVENEHCLAWAYEYSDANGYCYLGKRKKSGKNA